MLARIVVGVGFVVACSKGESAKKARVAQVDAACDLAIVLDPDGVSIGTHAGACRAPRIDGKPDLAWVENELRTLKWEMATCSNAVVIAETGLYREPIALMDLAIKTGFIDTGFGDAGDGRLVTGAHESHCKSPPPPRPPEKRDAKPAIVEQPVWPPPTPEEVAKLTAQMTLPPPSDPKETLQYAPVIVVTKTDVTYRGQVIATVDAVANDRNALAPLTKLLHVSADATKRALPTKPELQRACAEAEQGIRSTPGNVCPTGLVILQADETTDMRVINRVIDTGKAAGFDNWLFAVKQR